LESSENVSDEMSKFLKLAIFAGRGEILLFMIENYIAMYRNMNNILRASLITAHLVGDDTRKKLFRLVEGVYDGTVEWNERVDEKIQGGFILKVNGYMLDASVKTSIERVKKEIVEKNKRKV
jgi:F-type H+-transporting ATPase subunit delta